jgi:hypothetical protein
VEIASMAGLFACNPIVKVGPPLSIKPAGSSSGLTLMPMVCPEALLCVPKPQVPSLEILPAPPTAVMVPAQLLVVFAFRIVFLTKKVPVEALLTPPPKLPLAAELPAIVLFKIEAVAEPKVTTAPPENAALLPEKVELVMPKAVEFEDKVLSA